MHFSTLFATFSNMHRIIILSLLFLVAGLIQQAKAQGHVVVEVEPSVKEMEDNRTNRRRANSDKVRGYRILIGFYSNRSEAESLKNQAMGPYDEPNFKVYVGQFTLSDDADAALVEIRKKFSGATRISDIIRRPTK
jgi:hypothetical protein